MPAALTPEQEEAVEQGEVAHLLLTSDAFRRMMKDFEANAASVFFNTDITDKGELVGPELKRTRLVYLGYRAFIEHLTALVTHKQELVALAQMHGNDNGDSL